MTNLPNESSHGGGNDISSEFILSSEELREMGADLDYFPGAVFLYAAHERRVHKVSRTGIRSFGLTAEIIGYLSNGHFNNVFFPAGLRRMEPDLRQLIHSGDPDMVVSSILEYRALRLPRYVHISLRWLPGNDTLFGLAQYIPPSVWPSNVIQSKARQFRLKMMERFRSLTAREREVLRLIVYGKSNPEVAAKLDISVNTVKTHRKNVHVKLDISHPGDIIKYAVAFDLVEF